MITMPRRVQALISLFLVGKSEIGVKSTLHSFLRS
jgi:hypothetical protein